MERKKTKMKNKILYIIMAIIIIAGIVVGCTAKFKFSLAYDDSNRIEVYIGKDYTKADVESIAKEVFGTDDPAEVQKKVADWDTYKATAAELKEKGYQMTSTVNDS